jgi:hypothetical protein
MRVLLFSSDLMISSRVEGAAVRANLTAKTVSTISALAAECGREAAAMIFVDLSTAANEVAAIMRMVRSAGVDRPAIVAFGPHVHEAKLAAARAAGCDQVLSRGQFFAQLDAILGRAANAQEGAAGD